MKLLSPKYDVVFHALFREENKELLSKMLTAIIKEKISVKTIDKNRYVSIKDANEKLGIMDLVAELENKEICNIEIQLNYFPNIINRMIYYSDKCYTRQIKKGEDYSTLKRVISILILDYNLEELKEFDTPVTKWKYREEETKKTLTSIQTLVITILPKVIKLYNKNPNDKLCQWLMFIDNPNSKEVQNIMEKNKDIEFALSNLEQVSGNERLKRIAELKEKARRDEKASLNYATEKGLKQGIKQERKEMLTKMQKAGFSIKQIKEITNLELDEIKELLEN